jgi:hypothetical protein
MERRIFSESGLTGAAQRASYTTVDQQIRSGDERCVGSERFDGLIDALIAGLRP